MKLSLFVLAGAGIIALGFVSRTKPVDKQTALIMISGSSKTTVVLELFTSEGCSSCPPADNLLPQLAKLDSNIIPLSFHVDYWNRLGWTDPFSNAAYSDRQRNYADYWRLESVYTPQLIINGEYEVVGSNKSEAESAIKKALQEKSRVIITIDAVKTRDEKVQITCHTEGDFKKTDIIAVLVQKKAVMKVRAGENSGATLSHINVVRSFIKQAADSKNEFSLALPKNLSGLEWQLVIFSQQKNDLKITGAVMYQPNRQ